MRDLEDSLNITVIDYDPELRALDVGLSHKEIARLEKYGFTQFRRSDPADFNAGWSAEITGQRHDHNSLSTHSGADLLICCSSDLEVILDTRQKMARNRRFNAMLRPSTLLADCEFGFLQGYTRVNTWLRLLSMCAY